MPPGSIPTRHSEDWVYTRTLTRLLDLTPSEEAIFRVALSDNIPDSREGLEAIVTGIVKELGTRHWPSAEPLFDEFCLECDAMHGQFDFLLYEMDLSVEMLHKTRLEDRRLALLYHADNFCLRLYSYREKIYQLVNQALRLGIDLLDRNLRGRVREAGHGISAPVIQLLDSLDGNSRIHRLIRERNAIVHRIALRQGASLSTRQQAEDHLRAVGPPVEVDRVTRIDTHHQHLQADFGEICSWLNQFRAKLAEELHHNRRNQRR